MRPGAEIIEWLSPVGLSVRLIAGAFSWQSFKNLSWREVRGHCRWIGLESFALVAVSAVVVAIALLIQCVIELEKFRMHDLAGALISLGLLREIGPLTVGLAWCGRIAHLVSEEARAYIAHNSELEFAQRFILPRYIAALMMAVPLASYGLVIGFLTGAFFAPVLSVSTTGAFLNSAQKIVENRDLLVYFLKLGLFFPFVTIFAGCTCGILRANPLTRGVLDAVTATFVSGFVANLMVTIAVYCR